jgi:membrane associated rhomboid family serine protease
VFPYRDENESVRPAVVTMAIIAANVLVWLLVQGAGREPQLARTVCNLGLIPREFMLRAHPDEGFPLGNGWACLMDPGDRAPLHILYSMFLHGGWMHLLGNMWFLWIFGDNVEDSMGRLRFLAFYLLCGLAAALTQVLSQPDSMAPMVGASGAIGGVMGAYVVLYPRVKVYNLVFFGFFFTTIALPAWVMLGYWFLLQLLGEFGSVVGGGGGVAFMAHVGGFLAGALLIKPFARADYVAEHAARQWAPRRIGMDRGGWS